MKYEIRVVNDLNKFAMIPVNIKKPVLTGSEKQIAWANDLIDTALLRIQRNDGCHAQRLAKNIDIDDPRMESELDALGERIQAKYDAFFAHTAASFYIDKLRYITENTGTDVIQARITV